MCDPKPEPVEPGKTHCWQCDAPLNEESRDGFCSDQCGIDHMEEEVRWHRLEYHGPGHEHLDC
jgi:predicted nucleic acid-binding Zn ribbon protein